VSLELEPPDHSQDPLIRTVGGSHGLGVADVLQVPRPNVPEDRVRQSEPGEDPVDMDLVVHHVGNSDAVEEVRVVHPVAREEHVHHEVTGVDDRTVDVEDDRELVVVIRGAHPIEVLRECPHPAVASHGAIALCRATRTNGPASPSKLRLLRSVPCMTCIAPHPPTSSSPQRHPPATATRTDDEHLLPV
jgi:hypothetical protein